MRLKSLLLSACATAGLLLVGSTSVTAQETSKDKEVTVTGCLNGGEKAGEFVLTDQTTGKHITVSGPADLAKHASNHTVKVTGTQTPSGDSMVVTKIEHVATSCTAPGQ